MTGSDLDGVTDTVEDGGAARASRSSDRDRLAQAAMTGLATALWYALPDHVASRSARVWVKTGLAAVLVAWSILSDQTSEAARGAPPDQAPAGGTPPEVPSPPDSSERIRWVGIVGAVGFVGIVVSGLIGSVALTVKVERAVHRLGQRAARGGAPYPHTRNGLVLGVATALVTFGTGRGSRR